MKAWYASDEPCWLCGLPWAPGASISMWLGDWVHEGCKAARAASVASEGVRTELPDARGYADKKDFTDFSVIKNRKVRRATIIR